MVCTIFSQSLRPGSTQVEQGTIFFNFYDKTKLLVTVLGPISDEELVSVEEAPFSRSARYEGKINILTGVWF